MLKVNKDNLQYASIGLNIAAGMFFFTFIGYKIDQKRGGQAWTLVGIFLGLFYCGYEIWKLIKQLNNQDNTNTKK